ncbi:MAG: NAD(P)-binding protein [Deltaproteobacteria bacterium]|nr:NAD(P)-binding protein [Deltaproteobacteria bacterium]
METKPPFDGLIIGSGIGGLSAGILLSLLNYRVAVVERNLLPGGLMRGYRRGGVDLPVGIHYFGSFGKGEPVRRMCDVLGVTEKIAVERMGGQGPIDRYLFDDRTFDLPEGIDAFVAALGEAFPADGRAIAAVGKNLRTLIELQKSFAFLAPTAMAIAPDLFAPLGAYLDGMSCSAGLKRVLGVSSRWMGMPEEECPVFYHHLALTSYLMSSWRLKGSGADLAAAFVARFEALGGTLLCGDPVTEIRLSGKAVDGVRLASGEEVRARQVIAAIHPKKVLEMLPEGAILPRRARRVKALAETEGLFALGATVDAAAHPALPYNLFRLHSGPDGSIVDGFFYQLLPGEKGKNLLVAMTKSPYAEWRQWAETTTGRRGSGYEREKTACTERLFRAAEGIFGSLKGVKLIDAYTPLTLRDWMDTPEGSPYGILRSMQQLPVAATFPRMAPPGLWFAGQNALSPGVLGTLLGSFQTVRQMIGPVRFAAEVFTKLTGK